MHDLEDGFASKNIATLYKGFEELGDGIKEFGLAFKECGEDFAELAADIERIAEQLQKPYGYVCHCPYPWEGSVIGENRWKDVVELTVVRSCWSSHSTPTPPEHISCSSIVEVIIKEAITIWHHRHDFTADVKNFISSWKSGNFKQAGFDLGVIVGILLEE